MKAQATLWIDERGKLREEPPSRGFKIAAFKGDEIQPELIKRYGLSEKEGKIMQEQKQQDKADNKAVKAPPNKAGSGLSITRSSRRGKKVVEKKEASD